MTTYFIAGIDTDAGKTIATGCIAKYLMDAGKTVITQKLAQTGCTGISTDIEMHRRLMHMPLTEFDVDGSTCPYVFTYPASPHLAAQIDDAQIDCATITKATARLRANFEFVLLEGVGGLHVPLSPNYTTLDYLREQKYPVILISSSKLGSINHTLLTLEVMRIYGIELKAVLYNHFPDTSPVITTDSAQIIQSYTKTYFPNAGFAQLPIVDFDTHTKFLFAELGLFV